MNDIRNILVENPKSESRLYLSLKTNILTDEQPCLYHIVSFLEMFLDIPSFALTTKTISIRHNSPYEIIAVVVGATYVLSKIVESITNIFHNVRVTGDDIIGIRNAQKNGAQNDDLDNQLKAAALRKENMEIKKLELEIEQLQADIAKNNVHTNITHNIKENGKKYIWHKNNARYIFSNPRKVTKVNLTYYFGRQCNSVQGVDYKYCKFYPNVYINYTKFHLSEVRTHSSVN